MMFNSVLKSYLNTSVLKFNPELEDPGFGSDAVILDLEDAVHWSAKGNARDALATLNLNTVKRKSLRFGVRMNSLHSIEGIRDLELIYTCCESGSFVVDFLQIPKVQSDHDVILCKSLLEKLPKKIKIIPIIEVPEAIEHIERIAKLSDAMMFGQVDMISSMYQTNKAYLAYARGRFCVACAQEGIAAIDTAAISATLDITNTHAFEEECILAKNEGFIAKSVIHPAQVTIVNKIFAVSEQEIDQYLSLIKNYECAKEGFSLVNGLVVAPPFVARAKKMLEVFCPESLL